MGIFTRFRDIITSNISSMLDSAEDPEKLIRLMLREMEETLVELKTSCAATMAETSQTRQARDKADESMRLWEHRAELAVQAGREDMAREAVSEHLQARDRLTVLDQELAGFEELVRKCREDMRLLEERIAATRDKQRLLCERHTQARVRRQAREQVQAADALDAKHRFDDLDQRIARMEYEADLAYTATNSRAAFQNLEHDAAVNAALQALKDRMGQ